MGATKELKLDKQTLFVARLDRRLLHKREVFQKAVSLVVKMYNEQSNSEVQRQILTVIVADLKSHEWCSNESSGDLEHALLEIRNDWTEALDKRYRYIIDRKLVFRNSPD